MAAPSTPNCPLARQPPSCEKTGSNNSAPYPYPVPGYGMGPAATEGQAPPDPTQPPNMPPGPTVVQAVYIQAPLSYDLPVQMQCPLCRNRIMTLVSYRPGTLTWLTCGGLFCCGCWLGCCLIPFLVDDLKDAYHYCPCCNAFLGTYKRL